MVSSAYINNESVKTSVAGNRCKRCFVVSSILLKVIGGREEFYLCMTFKSFQIEVLSYKRYNLSTMPKNKKMNQINILYYKSICVHSSILKYNLLILHEIVQVLSRCLWEYPSDLIHNYYTLVGSNSAYVPFSFGLCFCLPVTL